MTPHTSPQGARRLWRATDERLVAGVAAGLADYLDIDVVVVRVALVALALAGGVGVPLYLAAWLLVPDEVGGDSVAERLLGDAPGDWTPAGRASDGERRRRVTAS